MSWAARVVRPDRLTARSGSEPDGREWLIREQGCSLPADDYESGLGEGVLLSLFAQTAPERRLAWLQAGVREDEIRLAWIETEETRRGEGLASALLAELQTRYPGLPLNTGGAASPEGEAFSARHGIEICPDSYLD